MKVGYARKSKGEPESLDMQISRLVKAECHEILSDIKSGRTSDRSQWKKLIALIESDKVTEIVVTRIDRLGRSLVSLCEILKLIEEKKIKLTILDAPVGDPSSPFGWYSLTQMSIAAEFESRMLSDRVKHGMNHLRESKKTFKAAFGYERTKEGMLIPHQFNWVIARATIEAYLEAKTIRSASAIIWTKYNFKWSVTGLRDWLRNPQLRGNTVYNMGLHHRDITKLETHHNTHVALITEKEFQQIEILLQRGKSLWGANTGSKTASNYPLAMQIYCGDCNGKCYRTMIHNTEYIRCRKHSDGKQFCLNKSNMHLEKIEDAVIKIMVNRAEAIAKKIYDSVEEIIEPPKLQELRKQLSGLMTLGNNPAIISAIDDVRSQILNEESAMRTNKPNHNLYLELVKAYEDTDYFKKELIENRIELYHQFVEKVVINNGQVQEVLLKIH